MIPRLLWNPVHRSQRILGMSGDIERLGKQARDITLLASCASQLPCNCICRAAQLPSKVGFVRFDCDNCKVG